MQSSLLHSLNDDGAAGKEAAFPQALRMLVIIPAFNEEHSLEPVIEQIRDALPGADVLVVNDG
ncbi:MAG: hypothetical protein IT326_05245, partial [Anaerolineae bacterium]|nr:hypothetical protein [Anaerolineae bacterium]